MDCAYILYDRPLLDEISPQSTIYWIDFPTTPCLDRPPLTTNLTGQPPGRIWRRQKENLRSRQPLCDLGNLRSIEHTHLRLHVLHHRTAAAQCYTAHTSTMERQGGLVDLKLVSKYYPVSNYSYPRKEPSSRQESRQESRCERTEDRVSFGSDCSVPGMVDDQGSEASNEDDHEYHVTGAELWDSFWQGDVAKQQRRHLRDARRGLYPAGVPYPTARRGSSPQIRRLPSGKEDEESQTFRRGSDSGHAPTWPLPPLPSAEKPKLANKPSYSLFPQQLPTPPRPVLPPRISSLPTRPEGNTTAPRPAQRPHANIHSHTQASHSISSIRRGPKPKHVHVPASEGSITLEYLNWTNSVSAPVSPMLCFPSPPPQSPVTATSPISSADQVSAAGSRPQSRARRPSLATFRSRSESTASSQPMSSPTFPSPETPTSSTRPPSSSTTASGYCYRPTTPLTITTFASAPLCPERIPPPPPPPNVTSFFDDDSDEEGSAESDSFAKRFVRGLALGHHGHHKRSHSEGRKTAKGSETAKEQLRRARADTTCGAPAVAVDTNSVKLSGESDRPRPQLLRKQKSEVFTRVLGRKSR